MPRRKKTGPKPRVLNAKQLAALRDGLDTGTADGLRTKLDRLGDLVLTGKLAPDRARAVGALAAAERSLIIEANADVRGKQVLKARDQIIAARKSNAGMNVRDVGAPPDDKTEGLGLGDAPTTEGTH